MRYIAYPYFGYPYLSPVGYVADTRVQTHYPFPPVNTERLNTSAHRFQELMKQADLLINKIVNEPTFSKEIMEAAQQSDKEKVDALISSTGMTIKVVTDYHPSGISFELDNTGEYGHCCKLRMALSW